MRERVEHLPFVGEDERRASWILFGETIGAGPRSTAALARLGYTGMDGGIWRSRAPSDAVTALRPALPAGATTLGCWSFDPSDRAGCENDCLAEMGDDSSGLCEVFLDCGSATRTLSASELDALSDEVSGETSLGFKRGPRMVGAVEEEEALITAAWNLLLQNLDLVVWAVCKATGDVGTTELAHLLDRINGSGGRRVTVKVTDIAGSFMSLFGTSIIWVSRGGPFTNYMEMWTSGTDNERLCAALDFAATLFHELTHLAGYTYIDLGTACYVSYLIENAFRWSFAHRYSDAATGCCDNLADDSVYGCGDPVYADFSACSSSGAEWEVSKGFWEAIGNIVGFVWNGIRLIVGGVIGAIRRGAEEVWGFVAGLIETLWGAIEDGAEAVVEWATDTWGRIVDWLGDLFGGSGGDGGGCCYCACNHCYEYCPELFRNDCNCSPVVDWGDEAMMNCQARCVEGMMEEAEEPASAATPTGR